MPCATCIQVMSVTTCVVVWIEIRENCGRICRPSVTTCVVVWIEISRSWSLPRLHKVTTCVVVWIEIYNGTDAA